MGCETREVFLVPGDAGRETILLVAPNRGFLDGGCVVDVVEKEPAPLGIYMMVDQSSSMTGERWSSVVDALTEFVTAPESEGLSVGIQYFALSPTLSFGLPTFMTVCDPREYAQPDEPILPLPDNAPAIIESLGRHGPLAIERFFGSTEFLRETPTDAALEGAVERARAWAAEQNTPEAIGAVLLVTDGVPGADLTDTCSPSLENTEIAAQQGAALVPPVQTFVLGVGSDLESLDRIATAGGTGQAYLVPNNGSAEILEALKAIREVVVPCRFPVPESTEAFGRDRLNLVFRGGDGRRQSLFSVEGAGACGESGGWYYAEQGGAIVNLCESTCLAARSEQDARLQFVLGCATQTR